MAAIVFDFDGTLGDSLRGILATAHEVLRRMDWPAVDEKALIATIGLPLRENFTQGAGMDDAQADRAVAIYRAIFDTVGAPEVRLFPGVREPWKPWPPAAFPWPSPPRADSIRWPCSYRCWASTLSSRRSAASAWNRHPGPSRRPT